MTGHAAGYPDMEIRTFTNTCPKKDVSPMMVHAHVSKSQYFLYTLVHLATESDGKTNDGGEAFETYAFINQVCWFTKDGTEELSSDFHGVTLATGPGATKSQKIPFTAPNESHLE